MNGIVVTGAGLVEAPPGKTVDERGKGVDPNRLRRMDRFGRAGFLAGHAALVSSGYRRADTADPRGGVVFGTAFGCRDSITDHAALVVSAARVEELRPALFAETVHNTVNGELAIEWNLGGVSEVVVSGRCAGLEALLLAARRLEEDAAELVVAGGAEGLHEAMRRDWEAGRERFGAGDVEAVEAGAALVLERRETARGAVRAVLSGGVTFFEPDPVDAARRLAAWILERFGEDTGIPLLASPALDAFPAALERLLGLAAPAEAHERFGASGPVAAVRAVELLAGGKASSALVVVRDPDGPTAAVRFEASRLTPSRSRTA